MSFWDSVPHPRCSFCHCTTNKDFTCPICDPLPERSEDVSEEEDFDGPLYLSEELWDDWLKFRAKRLSGGDPLHEQYHLGFLTGMGLAHELYENLGSEAPKTMNEIMAGPNPTEEVTL